MEFVDAPGDVAAFSGFTGLLGAHIQYQNSLQSSGSSLAGTDIHGVASRCDPYSFLMPLGRFYAAT